MPPSHTSSHSASIRPTAVAGMFYPDERTALQQVIADLLRQVSAHDTMSPRPRALIVPHAGYLYSGAVAATAYARLQPWGSAIRRVAVLGPSHRVPLVGIAVPSQDFFTTPLGEIPVDRATVTALLDLPQVLEQDPAHRLEHSIEVQLPFLQTVMDDFLLTPLVVGHSSASEVAAVLERLGTGDDDSLIVVSSDLSHYHDYREAREIDRHTSDAILHLEHTLNGDQACGCHAVNGLLLYGQRRGLEVQLLDLRNSGDTAGPRDRVVGYGAWALTAGPETA